MSWASPGLAAPGNLRGFGYNFHGQVGNGNTTDQPVPAMVMAGPQQLSNIVQVAVGQNHAVALSADGTVYAWGANSVGQLGNGGGPDQLLPIAVRGVGGIGFLGNVVAVSAGTDFTVAVMRDGAVVAWGNNVDGELGNGTASTSSLPVAVHGEGNAGFLGNVVSVACGFGHSLALKADGTVVSWGYNATGALGDGSFSPSRNFPMAVSGLSNVTAVACGSGHSLALKSNHTVVAWGAGTSGQLGNSLSGNNALPVVVSAVGGGGTLGSVTAIACGGTHSLALRTDGGVVSWGDTSSGQLGIGVSGPSALRNSPQVVQAVGGGGPLANVKSIAGGSSHSLALLRDGTAVAWGFNDSGQLGDNDPFTTKAIPVVVRAISGLLGSSLGNVSQVAAGALSDYSMALVSSYQAVTHTVGTDGLSRVLFWAPGADASAIRIDTLTAAGQTKTNVATFDPPAGTPIPQSMILAGTNLAVLFVDSLSAPTQASIVTVPQSGGTVVRSLATAYAGRPLNLFYYFGSLYLFSRAGGIGGAVSFGSVSTPQEGVALTFSPGVYTNPNTDPANGYQGVAGAVASDGRVIVLYNAYASGNPSGWVLARYAGAGSSQLSATQAGVSTGFFLTPTDVAKVLTTTGSGATATWTANSVALPPSTATATTTLSPAQSVGASLGQLQPISLAYDPVGGEPRLLLANDLTWLRKHLGLGTVTESRPGSGRIWKLDATTLNPSWASLAFRD
ncbi:MAG TPA: hypothetical protein VGN26_01605 [Armatimonadota bacterium]|jgi:alpha-tubulin suppressor-like RCC1 family protein